MTPFSMFIILVIAVGIGVAIVSFAVIRYAARRPINGEVQELRSLDRKILNNQQIIEKLLARHIPEFSMRKPRLRRVL